MTAADDVGVLEREAVRLADELGQVLARRAALMERRDDLAVALVDAGWTTIQTAHLLRMSGSRVSAVVTAARRRAEVEAEL